MHRDPQALAGWKASFVDPPRAEVEAEAATRHVRSVWISDVHLGTPGCKAGALLAFLKQVQCDNLFLVGDIVDGWQLRRCRYWPRAHNAVVQKLLRKARKGTRVVFIPATTTSSRAATSAASSAASSSRTSGCTRPPTAASSGSRTATSSTA